MRLKEILRWSDRSDTWKTVFTLVNVVLVILSGYTVFAIAMGSTTPLVVVTSGSMEPALYRGDLLIIQKQSEDQIEIDDIIVFWADGHPDSPIVHRVVKIYDDEQILFTTKGDNNPTDDWGNRTIDDIVGVVVGIIPYLGHVSLFLQTLEGKIVMIVFFVLILILPELYERRKIQNQT